MPKDEVDLHDPNELVGVGLEGTDADEELMASCLVEEYLRMGFSPARILQMFRDPFYRLTHGVFCRNGEPYVRSLIDRLSLQWTGGTTCPR